MKSLKVFKTFYLCAIPGKESWMHDLKNINNERMKVKNLDNTVSANVNICTKKIIRKSLWDAGIVE